MSKVLVIICISSEFPKCPVARLADMLLCGKILSHKKVVESTWPVDSVLDRNDQDQLDKRKYSDATF